MVKAFNYIYPYGPLLWSVPFKASQMVLLKHGDRDRTVRRTLFALWRDDDYNRKKRQHVTRSGFQGARERAGARQAWVLFSGGGRN